jgi:hypothetical protein
MTILFVLVVVMAVGIGVAADIIHRRNVAPQEAAAGASRREPEEATAAEASRKAAEEAAAAEEAGLSFEQPAASNMTGKVRRMIFFILI